MMKTKTRTLAVLATTAVLGTGAALTASALTKDAPQAVGTTTVSATLPSDAAKQLQLTREEERMARDLYAALATAHDNARPMSMITVGEDRHYDAVGTLLSRYGVSDPSAGRAAGSYAYPEIQKLYDQWLAKGEASVNATYQVGVDLEKWDIASLRKDVANTTQTDVKGLYTNLLTASQHHLSMYEAAASGQPAGPGDGTGSGNGWRGMGQGMGNGMGPGMAPGMGSGPHRGQGFAGDCPMVDGTE